ncbi:MAG: CrcB family protein [Solirubrobacteraceae bacterium]
MSVAPDAARVSPGAGLLLAAAAGGAIGSMVRALVAEALDTDPGSWPWETLVVNVTGALLLGAVVTVLAGADRRSITGRMLLGTGLCGGLTTFSTLQLEVLEMLDADALGRAAGYVAASVAVGLVAALAGVAGARSAGFGVRPVDGRGPTGGAAGPPGVGGAAGRSATGGRGVGGDAGR